MPRDVNPFDVREEKPTRGVPEPLQKHEDPPGDVEIDLSQEEEEPEPEMRGEPQPTRLGKKSNRFKEATERAEAAERERDAERVRAQQIEMTLIAERAARSVVGPGQQQQQKDPLQEELDALYHEQRVLGRDYVQMRDGKTLTAEKEEEFHKKAEDIDKKQKRLAARMEMRDAGVMPGAGKDDPQKFEQNVALARIKGEYPDVAGRPDASRYAKAAYDLALASGKPNSWETVKEVMDETRVKYGLASRKPSEGNKSKFTGTASGGSGGGGGGGDDSSRIVMSDDRKRLARKLYPDMPPMEAYKTWAKECGPEALRLEKASRSQ